MMKQLYTLIGLLTGFAGAASAQQFTLQNTVINGGSQIAHGGPFSVAATSGTPTT